MMVPLSKWTFTIFRCVTLLLICASQAPVNTAAQHAFPNAIIPAPVSVAYQQGSFQLGSTTIIGVQVKHAESSTIAAYLADKIKVATGFHLKIVTSGESSIQFVINPKADTKLGREGYTLHVTEKKITVTANSGAGLFYGVQTLLQLLPKEIESTKVVSKAWHVPVVSITDYPRFAWRGMMLDVSRHYFSKAYVKSFIDRMARYKFNRFHWHLTDDQGWRVEIKSLPELTRVGAWRVPRTGTFGDNAPPKPGEVASDGGFYTHEDIKEIVQYARQRYIEILPEIDVPGHSMAAIASYPSLSVTNDTSIRVSPGSDFSEWYGDGKFEMFVDNSLDPTDEKVYQFLDKVFSEIAGLFPFEYIHMGGDECYKGYWERDAGVQAFMKKKNITNSHELQSYFAKRVSKILAAKKKKMIGWDEILEGGLAPGAAVMSWRGTKGGVEAAHQKHSVVMSPAPIYYLDMMQGDASIEPPVYSSARLQDVYAFDILPKEIDSTYVLGGQGNLWTEQVPTPAQVEYMVYPRAFAIAESMWSQKSKKNWGNFVERVEEHFARFDEAKVNYATSLYDPLIKITKGDSGIEIALSTEVEGLDLHYTIDNSVPNQYHPRYEKTIVLPPDVDYFRVISYRDGKPLGHLITLKKEEIAKRVQKK
ncbi:beta-N-acetylhexosaminidase [Pseudochryseolinea flava]|uniref:beta-N-acetylhexosaminidase n=1 Tax=Pseudochryseolinea flava TaxID=2059302 RepID=A0A364Y116_9BACT|nr:family 20 glycosylhydrolase [Pseudochryseolinea flava]RAW00291.1 beta-N-acetylhexosaminidase [Pseudochryseolinea flava]